jgi:hypothetical protein
LWDIDYIELEIGLVLQPFEEELVLSLRQGCYISKLAIDAQTYADT